MDLGGGERTSPGNVFHEMDVTTSRAGMIPLINGYIFDGAM